MKPLAIDLYCGLGGWADGLLSEGFDVIGFDIERHDYGTGGYPGQLVIQDVLTLHGSQFKNAAVILASPPCQEYSYMAMPWARAKQIAKGIRNQSRATGMRDGNFPDGYIGSRNTMQLNALFDACFRIQREASEAAGRHIPLVVENVRGAQPWVGRSSWTFGSFHLWGDVPALMPHTVARKILGYSDPRSNGGSGAHLTSQRENDGRKVIGLDWSKHGTPGYKAQGFNVEAARRHREGVKNGNDWFGAGGNCSAQRRHSSRSDSRKAASAQIAKIPFPLASWIARCYKPHGMEANIA